ncbi:MAG: c-type cytochrome domain-containing protein, partial [Balneolaceae bacterium]|nr:c-type cytochrome domain-containing protein [Balneolaceae bacterium]
MAVINDQKYENRHKMWYSLAGVILLAGAVFLWYGHEEPVDYNTDIKPILNENCLACHGGVKKNGKFSLLFKEEAFSPNESGRRAIVPGEPGESEMIRRITHPDPDERMPPEGDPLPEEQVALIRNWIDKGAEWGTHWAYQQPQPVTPPD